MNKKYEIVKNGIDNYSLKYKDKELKMHSSVGITTEMQKANKNARVKLIMDLASQGKSIKELTKEIKKDGKTYSDNSNKAELEKVYLEEEYSLVFDKALKEIIGMTFEELVSDIGIETQEEAETLSIDLGYVLTGKTPR